MSTNRLPKSRESTDRIKANKVVEYFHSREHAILGSIWN